MIRSYNFGGAVVVGAALCALAGCGGSDDNSVATTGVGGSAGAAGAGGGAAGKAGSTTAGSGGTATGGTGTGGKAGMGGTTAAGMGGASGKGGAGTGGTAGGGAPGTGGGAGAAGKAGAGAGGVGGGGAGGSAGKAGASGGGSAGKAGASGGTAGGSAGAAAGGASGAGGATGGIGGIGGTGGIAGVGGIGGSAGTGGALGGSGGAAGSGGAPACDPIAAAAPVYEVDPVNGDDALATGSGTAGGVVDPACAFKTVTAAIKAVGLAGTAKVTKVDIIGPSTVSAGETFPFVIPSNTTLTASVGKVTISVPAGVAQSMGGGTIGVLLAKSLSGIDGGTAGLVLDGQGFTDPTPNPMTVRQRGVVVNTGTDASNTFLRNVTIQGFADQGLALFGTGGVTVEGGVVVTTSAASGGWAVTAGDAAAVLNFSVPVGSTPTQITGNVGGGLQYVGQSTGTVTGVLGAAPGAGTLGVSKNGGPGVEINNVAAGSSLAISGLDVWQNGLTPGGNGASGVRVFSGAHVTMRGSSSIDNTLHGVHVLSTNNGTLANVDLGTPASHGKNTFETNTNAGICVEVANGNGLTLHAAGNIFGAAKNCDTTMATLVKSAAGCGKNLDIGNGSMVTVDFTMCQ